MKFYLQYQVGNDSYDLWLKTQGGRFIAPLTFQEPRKQGDQSPAPPMVKSSWGDKEQLEDGLEVIEGEAFLQAALEAAWEHGLRPKGYLDVRESNKAITQHLQDMKAITFHLLKLK